MLNQPVAELEDSHFLFVSLINLAEGNNAPLKWVVKNICENFHYLHILEQSLSFKGWNTLHLCCVESSCIRDLQDPKDQAFKFFHN
jgi:hypothetical protein